MSKDGIEIDRVKMTTKVAEAWSGTTILTEHGPFTVPDVKPGSVTYQIIEFTVAVTSEAVERAINANITKKS